ncbi:hypothetical protein QGP82_25260 [Leptothoe sp. LEGE 181152]|nr:hypothetical protein [Leptothoe sp. LEGE 181152]
MNQQAANVNAASGAAVTDAIGSSTIFPINGFSPARVVWNRATDKVLVPKRSAITNQLYGAYENVNRDSCAFGRAAEDDDMHDVFAAIKSQILTTNAGFGLNRVSLTRERRRYR